MTREREIKLEVSLKCCCCPQGIYICGLEFFTPAFRKVSVIMKRRGKPNKFYQAKSQSSNYSKYNGKRVIDFNWCPRGEGQPLCNNGSLWW